jgi:hypothetical protein
MVPMLTCGLVRSNLAFATTLVLLDLVSLPPAGRAGDGVFVGWCGPLAGSGPVEDPR